MVDPHGDPGRLVTRCWFTMLMVHQLVDDAELVDDAKLVDEA